MRRIALIALLALFVAPSCSYRTRGVHFPDRPTVQRGRGLTPGNTPRPQPSQCTEVSRMRCDSANCPGFKYDYVKVQCTGEGVKAYCQATGGCKAEATK